MKLTFRQTTFLSKILDVYQEMQEPLHYSVIAKKLGLCNSSTYDMFRLLEQKGMVKATYATPKEISGPGSSNVFFSPTPKAIKSFSRLKGKSDEREEWEDSKARIMSSLRRGEVSDKELLDYLIEKAPEARSPLARSAEIITALLINLREAKGELIESSSVRSLLRAPASKFRMKLLAGLILGLSLADQKVHRLIDNYQKQTEKYDEALQELDYKNIKKLHRFTRDIWGMLKRKTDNKI